MIDRTTRPGSPVLHRHVANAADGEPVESWEPTHTICRPFVLAPEANGLEGIAAGELCVYVAGVRAVRCADLRPCAGLHAAPGPSWGPFYKPNAQRWLDDAKENLSELVKSYGRDARVFDGPRETIAKLVYKVIKGGRA